MLKIIYNKTDSIKLSYCLILIMFFLCPTGAFADMLGGIKNHCSNEWPDDYSMQNYCIKRQKIGAQGVLGFMKSNGISSENFASKAKAGDPSAVILVKCVNKWPHQYDMVTYCIKKQSEAYKQLQ